MRPSGRAPDEMRALSFETNFTNARYGQPTNQYLPTRSIQLGLRYRW